MSSFFSEEELKQVGFAEVGTGVLISRKASIYSAESMSIGNNVRIDDFCILSGKITFGNYIHIAAYTALYGGQDGIEIRDYSTISSHSSVYSVSDDYSGRSMTNPMVPDQYRSVDSRPVYVGQHVIVGTHSVILPGANIRDGGAFGAFSMIKGETDEWMIYAGVPIHRVKERERKAEEMCDVWQNRIVNGSTS